MSVNVKVVKRTFEELNPIPPITLSDITRNTVDSFVSAQKALLEVMAKPARAAAARHEPPRRAPAARKPAPHKRTATKRKTASPAAVAASA
jgi:hypothetical protein